MLPSRRWKTARGRCSWSAASPAARSTAVTLVNDIVSFFGANASIDGGISVILEVSSPSQLKLSRENT